MRVEDLFNIQHPNAFILRNRDEAKEVEKEDALKTDENSFHRVGFRCCEGPDQKAGDASDGNRFRALRSHDLGKRGERGISTLGLSVLDKVAETIMATIEVSRQRRDRGPTGDKQ